MFVQKWVNTKPFEKGSSLQYSHPVQLREMKRLFLQRST